MSKFEILNLTESFRWDEYLRILPKKFQDIYYTSNYYRLYEELNDGKACCFVFEKDGDFALYPFLVNSINSLGFSLEKEYFDIQGAYGYNGVCYSTNNPIFITDFYKVFDEFTRDSNIIADFTRFNPILSNESFSYNYYNLIYDRDTVIINLDKSFDELFNSFQRTTKKQIKRALTNKNIDFDVKSSEFNVKEFYSIYCETMKRVNSIDYLFFNDQYFTSLISCIPVLQFSAYFNGEMIASIFCISNNETLHGHLGGAKTEFLKYSPYSLLYYEIIKEAKKQQFQKIHLGGGTNSDPENPLLKFKLNFSKTRGKFFIGKKIINGNTYQNVISQWNKKYPDKITKYASFLLKYRY